MMCTFLSATKCLKGVVICPFEKGGFQVFCDYTSGCEDMGCNYIITGEDMTYITGTISPNSFSHLSISIHSHNSITEISFSETPIAYKFNQILFKK